MANAQFFGALAVSLAIGLLVGLERERHPLTKAGLRTFALIALLGTLTAEIATQTGSPWILAAAVLAVTVALAGAYFVDPRTTADDSGTTTVVAALGVFCLGVMTHAGHWLHSVTIAVVITTLLHFKPELRGISQRLTAQDIRSMLQFAILTAVVLPLLPNEPLGPYGVLNPFQIWLMVLLISGVSLAGYVAWRLAFVAGHGGGSGGILLTGLLGGLVSSTATTVVYARHVRDGTHTAPLATVAIVLANAVMMLRVLLFTAVVSQRVVPAAALVLLPAIALALPLMAHAWRRAQGEARTPSDAYRNPTNLMVALAFGAGYAVVLLLSAWLAGEVGNTALYTLALVSGLTDVDAITLASLQLANTEAIAPTVAATAIAIAVIANLAMKTVLVFVSGDRIIGRAVARAFVGPVAGAGIGLVALNLLL
jgi:uncharacterized membrane protein (DUF4010 family)